MLRFVAIALLVLCGLSTSGGEASAQEKNCAGVNPITGEPLKPGDYKYMHDCLHEYFKEMYVKTKCHCHTGHCRPTLWRLGKNSETEVLIDGHWYAFSPSTLRERGKIPKELWPFPAIVCAIRGQKYLPDGRPEQNVECTVINSGT